MTIKLRPMLVRMIRDLKAIDERIRFLLAEELTNGDEQDSESLSVLQAEYEWIRDMLVEECDWLEYVELVDRQII